jgi:hypothetical protein
MIGRWRRGDRTHPRCVRSVLSAVEEAKSRLDAGTKKRLDAQGLRSVNVDVC